MAHTLEKQRLAFRGIHREPIMRLVTSGHTPGLTRPDDDFADSWPPCCQLSLTSRYHNAPVPAVRTIENSTCLVNG